MDLLDRLLGHDAWATRQLLERCATLPEDQLDRAFPIDHGSARALLRHMIGNVEVWTDLMLGRPVRRAGAVAPTLAQLATRHDLASTEFARLARDVLASERLDDLWTDHLDDPPASKTFGGGVLHVLTHNMQHRAHLLLVLGWLGLEGLPEGDLLSWEASVRADT